MPSHESESLEGSSCKRLRVSSLVDMSGDEEHDVFDLCATAAECLEELRSRGVDVALWKKMVETAFDKTSSDALNRLIERMRRQMQVHDARQAAPLAPAPDPSALPALSFHSASPAPNSPRHAVPLPAPAPGARSNSPRHDVPLPAPAPEPPLPRATSETCSTRFPEGAKRARTRLPEGDKSGITEKFRTFAFAFGRQRLLSPGGEEAIGRMKKATIVKAFWEDQGYGPESNPPLALPNYFEHRAWERAVLSNNIDLFRVALVQTPVQMAPTLVAKLELEPKLQPLVDWCVAWLRAAQENDPETEPRFRHLIRAYDDAKKQTPDQPAFQGRGAESLQNNCGVTMRMLQEYADGLQAIWT